MKTLEEQARQKPMEYVACVKKHQLLTDSNGDFSSWDEHFSAPFDEPLPEIEASAALGESHLAVAFVFEFLYRNPLATPRCLSGGVAASGLI
ncbi:hypothetical protein PVK06_013140 [Gossypium arboreum]|uniref:Uncharacterized protein n=1 Tax=Gossypium arboreum TaxID=29729 RepID=A0ABR0QDE2_GOSAR|nr:hypothetical protein PVK06_013140 [Gossypium arboreum]